MHSIHITPVMHLLRSCQFMPHTLTSHARRSQRFSELATEMAATLKHHRCNVLSRSIALLMADVWESSSLLAIQVYGILLPGTLNVVVKKASNDKRTSSSIGPSRTCSRCISLDCRELRTFWKHVALYRACCCTLRLMVKTKCWKSRNTETRRGFHSSGGW